MPTTSTDNHLLTIAREAVEHAANHLDYPRHQVTEESLSCCCGCFVTLKINGRLRGCIGNFQSDRPLYQNVADMAMAAATQDPRFPPISAAELKQITIEITILSPPEQIHGPDEIVIGTHGILIEHGRHRGVLLPQVAVEYGWDALTFLHQTCNKAGLAAAVWQHPETKIYRFSGRIMAEEKIRQYTKQPAGR